MAKNPKIKPRKTKGPRSNTPTRRVLPNHTRNRAKTRPLAHHKPARAGAKLLVAFYRAKFGARPDSVLEARKWYAGLHEPKYRAGESKKRIAALEAK